MNRENDIMALYLAIDAACLAITGGKRLRRRGPRPDLTDAEVLTIEVFGEMQGHHNDAAIWRSPANVDERDVLDNLRGLLSGLLIGDKGLLSRARKAELAADGIDLQTPLRDNMKDLRPKDVVQGLLKTRRRIETVIGQLIECFGFAACKARDLWHLTAKLSRKLLAYNLTSPKT
jgi:hypothetical protein